METGDALLYGQLQEAESDAYKSVVSQALLIPRDHLQTLCSRIGVEHFRRIKDGDQVAAGLGFYPMAQWFGGAKVKMAGITLVGVAPECRGKGVAKTLMRNLLYELHDLQYPISGLHPATLPLYRSVGYERSGSRIVYELATGMIDVVDRGLDMVPVEPGEEKAIYDAFEAQARQSAGLLDRHPAIWARWQEYQDKTVYKYLIKQGKQVLGYVIFVQNDRGEPMLILDYSVLTRDAGRRLLSFLGDHRTTIPRVEWAGGPLDPLLYLLSEQKVRIVKKSDWMTRIIDVKKALEARGYTSGLQAELHLDVTDDLLPWNHGRFVANLQDGKLQVEPGGDGRIHLGIRELAALYTGFQTPQELRLTGEFEASEADMGLTGLVFAGPRPWMSEIY